MVGGANTAILWTANEVTGTVGSSAIYTSRRNTKEAMTALGVSIEQNEFNPAFTLMATTYAPPTTGGAPGESGYYTDGTPWNSTSIDSPTVLSLIVGGVDGAGKRYFRLYVGKLSQDIHNVDQESGKLAKPPIKLDRVNNTVAMTLPSAQLPTAYYNTSDNIVIPAGQGWVDGWLVAA